MTFVICARHRLALADGAELAAATDSRRPRRVTPWPGRRDDDRLVRAADDVARVGLVLGRLVAVAGRCARLRPGTASRRARAGRPGLAPRDRSVSIVSAKGRALSAWKKVRSVPPAGITTRSRRRRVPSAAGVVRDHRGHEPERRARECVVGPAGHHADGGAVSRRALWRVSAERHGGPLAAERDARWGRRARRHRSAGRRSPERRPSGDAARTSESCRPRPLRPRRIAPVTSPAPMARDLDRPGPVRFALSQRSRRGRHRAAPVPSSMIRRAGQRAARSPSAPADGAGVDRLLLPRSVPETSSATSPAAWGDGHAGALLHLVAGVPARHRAVRDAGRHQIGLARARRRAS